MTLTIRPFVTTDIPVLYALYMETRPVYPQIQLEVTAAQFTRDLFTSRVYAGKDWFDPTAEIALVAEQDGQIMAYANGCLLLNGDFLIPDRTAFIRFVLMRRGQREAAQKVIQQVTEHLLALEPDHVEAFNGMFTPNFFGYMGGGLPTAWSEIGAVLVAADYEAANASYHLWCDLTRNTLTPPVLPDGFSVHYAHTKVNDLDIAPEPDYNVGYVLLDGEEFAGWCGNFYAGAFIEGAGYEAVYTHWFTVPEAYRTRGLGRKLLHYGLAEAQAKGAKCAMLLTDLTNFPALNLYQSEGYQILTVVQRFDYQSTSTSFAGK